MKLMAASDIHGSAEFCKQLFERVKAEKPDRLLLLGDLLYHGPRNNLPNGYEPKEVIDILNSNKELILCVRGNCEAEVDQMVLDFPCLADYALLSFDGIEIYATHGHLKGETNPPNFPRPFILLCGHTHVAKCKQYENYIYMNPGSVSIPKENTNRGYIIFENKKAIWKDLDGNIYNEINLGDF